jgi:PhzF family phenazine biosynthesis protein
VTRYFSPRIEIDFCGHATIAAAVSLGHRHGDRTYHLETLVGTIPVAVRTPGGKVTATLTSVEPAQRPLDPELLTGVLDAAYLTPHDLDPDLVPGLAYAGALHLVLPVRSQAILSRLTYDFNTMADLMTAHRLTTIQVVWREDRHRFHARNPFPVGGVVEDPATGAAAAALGGYLRHHRQLTPPADFVVIQGVDMGRPSRIDVHVPPSGGIRVSGTAVANPISTPSKNATT